MRLSHRQGTKDLESELQRYAAWFTRRKRELELELEREDAERIRRGLEENRRSTPPGDDRRS